MLYSRCNINAHVRDRTTQVDNRDDCAARVTRSHDALLPSLILWDLWANRLDHVELLRYRCLAPGARLCGLCGLDRVVDVFWYRDGRHPHHTLTQSQRAEMCLLSLFSVAVCSHHIARQIHRNRKHSSSPTHYHRQDGVNAYRYSTSPGHCGNPPEHFATSESDRWCLVPSTTASKDHLF